MSFNAVKFMKLNRDVHKWSGLILSIVILHVSVTGILLLFKEELGFQPETHKGEKAEMSEFVSIEKVITTGLAQGFEDLKTFDDIDRIDLRPSKNVGKLWTNEGREIQIELSTGKVLNVGYRGDKLLENLHDGSYFGTWVKYIVVTGSGVALILLTLSGFYIWAYPAIKRAKSKKRKQQIAA